MRFGRIDVNEPSGGRLHFAAQMRKALAPLQHFADRKLGMRVRGELEPRVARTKYFEGHLPPEHAQVDELAGIHRPVACAHGEERSR
jgi:hypothetical protein